MGPDLERKGRLGSKASDRKENEKEASMCRQAEQVDDLEVNITDSTSQDETEDSSSFGNTLSGDKEGDTLSDSEVTSKLHDNGFGQECRMRKKSLTAHWKTFIQPCMWRYRWAELRTRRLLDLASNYDLQAKAISKRKQLTVKNSTVEGSCARSLPFSGSNCKETLMKRRKRKRVEDSTDTEEYMAQHPLYSYSGSRKFDADVVASLNNSANRGIPKNNRIEGNFLYGCGDESGSLEFRSDGNSLEEILWKVGVLQSHLGELKTRFKKVHDENAKDIYSAYARATNDVPTSPAQNDVPTNEREKQVQVFGVASELMPECCDIHQEAAELIDIIECNDQLQIGISCEKEGNGQEEKPETLEEEEQPNIVPSVPVPLISISDDQPEKPKEEQANIVPSGPVPVIFISDDQPEKPEEEQATMNPSTSVPVISIADDQPASKKRSISEVTSSPHNTRSRGRGRRRGHRWSRRA